MLGGKIGKIDVISSDPVRFSTVPYKPLSDQGTFEYVVLKPQVASK